MKWIKLKAAFGDHAAGAQAQFEDSEAAVILKGKLGEEIAAPQEVVDKTTQLSDAVVDRLADRLVKSFEDRMPTETVTKGTKRPNYNPRLTTHDNELDDPTGGFKGLADFAGAVRKACANQGLDKRLDIIQKANGGSENVATDGGYAVPVEYATTIYNDIVSQDSLFNDCFTIPMASNAIKLPSVNYTTQGTFGVTAYWEGEGVTIPTSKPAYRQPSLNLNKLTALVPVTSELLEDGIAVESLINFLAAEAMTYKINEAILFGNGTGQPTGVVGHGSTVAVSRNTVNTVKAVDVITMNSQFNGNDNRGTWLINKADIEPQLLTMQDPNGRYLYFAPGTFAQDPRGKLLGKTVKPVINCAALGSHGDIILADLKSYVVGYKSTGVNKAMSIHLYFATDEVAYRWTFRMDGRPWRDTTLAAAKGSGTYSSVVTL